MADEKSQEELDAEGTGSSYGDLVAEADVPRVGDEGVEGVDVAGHQLKEEKAEEKSPASSQQKKAAS